MKESIATPKIRSIWWRDRSGKEQCEYFEAIIRKNYINHNEIKNKLLLKSENNANNKEKDFKESEVKKYLMVEQVKN